MEEVVNEFRMFLQAQMDRLRKDNKYREAAKTRSEIEFQAYLTGRGENRWAAALLWREVNEDGES